MCSLCNNRGVIICPACEGNRLVKGLGCARCKSLGIIICPNHNNKEYEMSDKKKAHWIGKSPEELRKQRTQDIIEAIAVLFIILGVGKTLLDILWIP